MVLAIHCPKYRVSTGPGGGEARRFPRPPLSAPPQFAPTMADSPQSPSTHVSLGFSILDPSTTTPGRREENSLLYPGQLVRGLASTSLGWQVPRVRPSARC